MPKSRPPRRFVKDEPGAPTILTPELQERIVNMIMGGAYVETAAGAAGVHKATFYQWLKKGARDIRAGNKDTNYAKFNDAISQAVNLAEMRDIAVIDKQAQNGDWRAAAWRLERKYGQRWNKQENVKVESDINLHAYLIKKMKELEGKKGEEDDE